MEAVIQASALFADSGPFSMMIVDSVMGLFRSEFSGRGDLAERQQKLGKHLAALHSIANEHNVAVVIINQCMADPGAMAMFGPSIKPIGGHILAHGRIFPIQIASMLFIY
jgi:meiotic recombination protein DMC1